MSISILNNGDTGLQARTIINALGDVALSGSNYVFVPANGTDTENASALQAAYDEAATQADVVIEEVSLPLVSSSFTHSGSGMQFIALTNSAQASTLNSGTTYLFEIDNIQYSGLVNGGFPSGGGQYTIIIIFSGLAAGTYNNLSVIKTSVFKSTVIVAPGYYNFETDFLVDTQYVNVVSLDGNRSVIFNGTGGINVTANDVMIKGIDLQAKRFIIGDNLNGLIVENCKTIGDYSFGGISVGEPIITISGTFIDCIGGNNAFGGGSTGATASGTFIDCTVIGTNGFGSGSMIGGTASGTFINCTAGNGSFAGIGGFSPFPVVSGTFNNCTAGDLSFGYNAATNTGTFTNCVAGSNSFKTKDDGTTGKVYYCRLTNGTFATVSGAGITRYCINGDGTSDNQG